jgi:RluA family pseudouridine synthase
MGEGLLTLNGHAVSPERIVRAGDCFENLFPATIEPDVNAEIRVLYEDSALVVIHKPAPLPMHPSGRFNRNTLIYILNEVYRPERLRPAHRLDANTSGVTVLTRTRHIARELQPEFDRGQVDKLYVARVYGHPPRDRFVCAAPIGEEVSLAGSRRVAENGLVARTECDVQQRCPDGTSLIWVKPITGRTNQIRLHLLDAGFPVVGDPMYHVDGQIIARQTLSPIEPPMCLHAWQLEFCHPVARQRMRFTAPLPAWAELSGA